MDESKDKLISIHIDSAISSCFEMVSHLMYMKTVNSETEEGRNQLFDSLEEIIDVNKSIVFDLKGINDLV